MLWLRNPDLEETWSWAPSSASAAGFLEVGLKLSQTEASLIDGMLLPAP